MRTALGVRGKSQTNRIVALFWNLLCSRERGTAPSSEHAKEPRRIPTVWRCYDLLPTRCLSSAITLRVSSDMVSRRQCTCAIGQLLGPLSTLIRLINRSSSLLHAVSLENESPFRSERSRMAWWQDQPRRRDEGLKKMRCGSRLI